MQLNINLATQPFEDARLFFKRWISVLVLLTLATITLVWYTAHNYLQARDMNRQIAKIRGEIKNINDEADHARAVLQRPENRGTVERSGFLNAIFARKAFSWTTVFSDLEQIMPSGLHVVSIQPALTQNNELDVNIVVAGESRDRAGELVRRMEKTPRFQDVTLLSESSQQQTTPGGGQIPQIQYTITARYQPRLPAAPQNKTGAEGQQNSPDTASLGGAR